MRNIYFMAIALLACTEANAQVKVLMMVPNDFMWPEYAEPRRLYEEAGFKVTTAGRFREAVNPDH